MKFPREFYIPVGAVAVRPDGCNAIAYTYETNRAGNPGIYAVGFRGKADKPAFHFRFRTVERRDAHIREFFEKVAAWEKYRAERRTQRKAFRHTLKVGDILRTSWGYDQTNVEYFEVVRLIGETMVEVWEIAQEREETGFMQGDCVPVPGAYLEKGERKRCRVTEGNGVKLEKWGRYASPVPMREVAPGVKVYPAAHWTAYA